MSNTICGHERSVLKTALLHPELCQAWSNEIESVNAHQRAWLALQDPAKLAEMLAQRGRQLGFDALTWTAFPDELFPESKQAVSVIGPGEYGRFTIPQARALLAAWLGLEDGDREGAEKALRGES